MTVQLARAPLATTRGRHALSYLPVVALGLDLVVVTLSVLVGILGQANMPFGLQDVAMGDRLTVAGPVILLGWIALILAFGGYRSDVLGAGLDEFKRTVNASLATAALVGIGCYALRFDLARGFFVLTFLVGIPALVLTRLLLRTAVHRARRAGTLLHRVVIAGSEGHVDEIASVLGRETWLGYQVVGALTPQAGGRYATHSGIPLLGAPQDVAEVAMDVEADVIFLAGGAFESAEHVRQLAWALEHEDVQVVIAPSVTDVVSDRISVRPVGGLPLIHLEQPRSQVAVRFAKRGFDIFGSLLLLVLTAPLLAWAVWQVRRQDGVPVLVRQTRYGRGGRAFTAWIVRTEQHDAVEPTDRVFPDSLDNRLVRSGAWLRRYSLDELPLLLSVLRGDMSLVGPRGPMAHDADASGNLPRLRVRPGLTGVWRDFRRSDLAWSETVLLDVHYAEHWSVLTDLNILWRTVRAVLLGAQLHLR
ncbi:hypothetical protein ASG49_10120 [Marmoricola sp. Leaf446]|uniref:exopolysaccharide biosynthesis polyprenyl glycosylphosphotransferase n=1 Tax=Marmoricola sp. Leaf446 TaxID=1736379 RepID=UPI0006F7C921|nr:exopolysaccharide biosynthesis polyprenyl glycosylphosphotransferase [Marmoricola sp. Leaf446]KQT92276.1 hypothetical protein ASG49_10120 [Marmoricola sp. Leaf446]